jgi:hypothetical protein
MSAQLVFYGAAAAGSILHCKSMVSRLLYLPHFFVSSNLAALSGLLRFLADENAHCWQKVARGTPGEEHG